MNWEQLKWWVKLAPRKQVVAGLAIIIVVSFSGIKMLFSALLNSKNTTIDSLTKRLEAKDKLIADKDSKLEKCQQESLARERENVEVERERNRKADSMNFALRAAEAALKKVAKNGN